MGIFSFLINTLLRGRLLIFARQKILVGSILVMLIVLTEEISQLWLVNRTFSLSDLLFDALGIYVGGKIALVWVSH